MTHIRQGKQRIAGNRNGRRNRIRLCANHGIKYTARVGHTGHVGMRWMHVFGGKAAVGLPVSRPARKTKEWILVCTQLLGTLLLWQRRVEFYFLIANDFADGLVPSQRFPALYIQIAADCPETASGSCRLRCVQALLVKAKAPGDHRRLCGGITSCRADHLFR